MPLKKPHTIKAFSAADAPHVDDNFNRLFTNKLECRYKWEGSSTAATTVINTYVECGQFTVSANGSANVFRSIPLQEQAEVIIYVVATARHNQVAAHVTNITATSIGIDVIPISSTGQGFSSAFGTNAVTVNFMVIGANPSN